MGKVDFERRYRDPCALTPYEQKIYDLRQQGMDWKQIAAAINNKSPSSIAVRYQIIKEKLVGQR